MCQAQWITPFNSIGPVGTSSSGLWKRCLCSSSVITAVISLLCNEVLFCLQYIEISSSSWNPGRDQSWSFVPSLSLFFCEYVLSVFLFYFISRHCFPKLLIIITFLNSYIYYFFNFFILIHPIIRHSFSNLEVLILATVSVTINLLSLSPVIKNKQNCKRAELVSCFKIGEYFVKVFYQIKHFFQMIHFFVGLKS